MSLPVSRLTSHPKTAANHPVLKSGIKPLKKTLAAHRPTSEEVLEKLALDYPLPKVILEYRGLAS